MYKVNYTYSINLSHYVTKKGITLIDLAESCGVSRQTIYNIGLKKTLPSIILAKRIADVLEVNIYDLFDIEWIE